MAWLHTWCGLVGGWLLCAIFLTGTLSVFREPITRWMQAKPRLAGAPGLQDRGLDSALRHLQTQAPDAAFWRLELPAQPGDALELFWRTPAGPRHAALDPATGALLPQPWGRQTEGGRHFMSFHYTLHGGTAGFWLVGAIAMGALAALASGVVVHRRIFQDFFTFRPGRGQRSWLDAHNATAVLTLPFLFMIVYTGLAFFGTSYMPLPVHAVYGWDGQAHGRYQAELEPRAGVRRQRSGQPAALPALAPLLQRAQVLNGGPARMLLVERPGDASAVLRVFAAAADTAGTRTLLHPRASVAFDLGGAVLERRGPDPAAAHGLPDAHHVVESLHVVSFGGWTMKWLYFVSGLLGTAMVATGVLLFSVKRRQRSLREFGAATARVYRVVESLNVAALAGTALASIAYFYANRLLPAGLTGRADWEIRAFLLVWVASLLHALLWPSARAWSLQLGAAALLCLALPLLNWATTGQGLWGYLVDADWQRAGVELVALGQGLVLAYATLRVQRKRR
ncbi:MAG: PepSY-associated TM helix domain-containing protein [Pseudorhodoferax sp.]